jgi:hypothetical protein
MPIPGVPRGVRRQVLDAVVNQLRTHPTLANRRAIKTWVIWNGKESIGTPAVDAMPAIQVRLLSGPVKRAAGSRLPGRAMTYINESNPIILIDLWTAGTDQGDLSDLADLVGQALNPADPGERAKTDDLFKQAGIKDCQLTREILPASAESFTLEYVSGQGTYELTVFTQA